MNENKTVVPEEISDHTKPFNLTFVTGKFLQRKRQIRSVISIFYKNFHNIKIKLVNYNKNIIHK